MADFPADKYCIYPNILYPQTNVVNILSTDFIDYSQLNRDIECNWRIDHQTNLGYIHILVSFTIDITDETVCGMPNGNKWIKFQKWKKSTSCPNKLYKNRVFSAIIIFCLILHWRVTGTYRYFYQSNRWTGIPRLGRGHVKILAT